MVVLLNYIALVENEFLIIKLFEFRTPVVERRYENVESCPFKRRRVAHYTHMIVLLLGGLPAGQISDADLGFVSYHFGTTSTNASWAEVSKADIDKNGVIDCTI